MERRGGRIGSERRAKNPPHIVARGHLFLESGLSEPEARTVCRQYRGKDRAEHSGADRAMAFRGCSRGCV